MPGVSDEPQGRRLPRPVNSPPVSLSSTPSSASSGAGAPARAAPRPLTGVLPSLLGDYACCDLVVKLKECPRGEASAAPTPAPEPMPEPVPAPAPPRPAPSQDLETSDLQEDLSECQQMAAATSLTLQVRPSACPALVPAEGSPFLGVLWSHKLTSASGAEDLTPLRCGCVTLGRCPNLSGPVSQL